MKKAKIMLAAVALFAVVGSSLAFRAKSKENVFLYTGTTNTSCPTSITEASTVVGLITKPFTITYYTTADEPAPCRTTSAPLYTVGD